MALMTGYHYEPTAEELEAAGMTMAQKNAIMQPYYDMLAAQAAAAEEERSGGRSSAYVPPEEPQDPQGPQGPDTPTFATVSKTAQDQKDAGVSAQEINDYLNAARQAGVITTDQRKSLKYTFGL
jgi:hypothetical protein